MEEFLNVPDGVQHIQTTLHGAGFQAYLVGGCVRDHLLGRVPKDYDLTTSASPEQVKELFPKVIDTGIKYGTVTVVAEDLPVEVTTFRSDGDYSDGRRPDSITFSNEVTDDVQRRDFTINGLLYDGEILDYVMGTEDLETRTIKGIGNAYTRFEEDALRMLRAVRFAAQLNFTIDHYTYSAIKYLAPTISNVSVERIQVEINKILLSTHPAKGFELLYDTGLLEIILPEVAALKYFEQKNPRHTKDVFDHTMRVVEATPAELTVRLAALLHDVGKPVTFTIGEDGVGHFYQHHTEGQKIAEVILKRLKYPNVTVEDVSILVKEHMCRNPYFRQTGLKRMINRVGVQRLPWLFDLMKADVIGHAPPYDLKEIMTMEHEIIEILEAEEPMKVTDLAIGGDDLRIWLGLTPGPIYKLILNELLQDVLDDPDANDWHNLIESAKWIAEREGY